MTLIGTKGSTLQVRGFKLYDIEKDEFVTSKRYGRVDAIERIGGVAVGPFYEVPADKVDQDGLTILGYLPG